MTLARLFLGWGAVAAFFLAWRALETRLITSAAAPTPGIFPLMVEAILLTLFAGLWFASLGSGGAPLLFLLVGALVELSGRWRAQPGLALPWKPVVSGIVRIVIAGVVLGLVMT